MSSPTRGFHPNWEQDPGTSPSIRARAAAGRGERLPPTPTAAEMTRIQVNRHVHVERSSKPEHSYATKYTQNLSPVAHKNSFQALPHDVNLGAGGEDPTQRAQHRSQTGSPPQDPGPVEQLHQPQNNTQTELHPDVGYQFAQYAGRGTYVPPAPSAPARGAGRAAPGGSGEQTEDERLENMIPCMEKTNNSTRPHRTGSEW